MVQLQKSGYLSNPQQAYTLRRVTIEEGNAKGAAVIEICTAGGLQVDILPDSGMDIGQVRYKGVNMTFISKNGYDSPTRFIPYENEFLKTFPGGLVYTCGLRSVGGGNRDEDGEYHPLHGRYHGLSAEQVATFVEDDTIIVQGVVRETALFGEVLEVKRTIRIPVFGTQIVLSDAITNLNPKAEAYALLYHCNFGYPLLSKSAVLELPKERKTTPRTDYAAQIMGKEHTFEAPIPGDEERCYFHEEMEKKVAIANPAIGAKMTMTWSDTLPILVQWRSMASGDYVCGLEPSNTYIMGRKDERANGTLPILDAYETVNTQITFTFETI